MNSASQNREVKLQREVDEPSADVFILRAEKNASLARLQEIREAAYSFNKHALATRLRQ